MVVYSPTLVLRAPLALPAVRTGVTYLALNNGVNALTSGMPAAVMPALKNVARESAMPKSATGGGSATLRAVFVLTLVLRGIGPIALLVMIAQMLGQVAVPAAMRVLIVALLTASPR